MNHFGELKKTTTKRKNTIWIAQFRETTEAELIVDESLNERNSNSDLLLICFVIFSKEVEESEFFNVNSSSEKLPRHDRVDHRTNWIAKNNLETKEKYQNHFNLQIVAQYFLYYSLFFLMENYP